MKRARSSVRDADKYLLELFPVGTRVRLSPKGAKSFPYQARDDRGNLDIGKVVSIRGETAGSEPWPYPIGVRWDNGGEFCYDENHLINISSYSNENILQFLNKVDDFGDNSK